MTSAEPNDSIISIFMFVNKNNDSIISIYMFVKGEADEKRHIDFGRSMLLLV